MMTPVLQTLFAIVLLRGRPQDLPVSRALVLSCALAAVVTDYMLDRFHEDLFERLQFAVTQTVLLGATVWGALRLRGMPERWMQTIAPLFAASALINILSWPVLAAARGPTGDDALWALTLGFAMTIWFLAVMVRVLRHALEASLPVSVLAAFACLLSSGVVLAILFPEVLPH
jgi:hypothetical protein